MARTLGCLSSTYSRPEISDKVLTKATKTGPERKAAVKLPEEMQEQVEMLRIMIRRKQLTYRTKQTYVEWVRRFLLFCCRLEEKGNWGEDTAAFLTHLAVVRKVAPATQAQALNALVFFLREVVKVPSETIEEFARPKAKRRLPVVISRRETGLLLNKMEGSLQLMAQLLYGAGLRLMECVRLRVKDLDFDGSRLEIRDAKGG